MDGKNREKVHSVTGAVVNVSNGSKSERKILCSRGI